MPFLIIIGLLSSGPLLVKGEGFVTSGLNFIICVQRWCCLYVAVEDKKKEELYKTVFLIGKKEVISKMK